MPLQWHDSAGENCNNDALVMMWQWKEVTMHGDGWQQQQWHDCNSNGDKSIGIHIDMDMDMDINNNNENEKEKDF